MKNQIKAVILSLIISLTVSCKEDKKANENSMQNDSNELVIKDKLGNEIKDLSSFLKANNKPNRITVNKVLGDKIDVEALYFFNDSLFNYVIFKTNSLENLNKENFRLSLYLSPTANELNLLREDTKRQNLKYDKWHSGLSELIKGKFIVFPVKTQIKEYKKVEIFLYDNTEKKYVPESITLEIKLENFLSSSNNSKSLSIAEDLGGLYLVEKVFNYRESDEEGFYCTLKTDTTIHPEEVKKYRFVVKTFPYEEDMIDLREDSKSTNSKCDSWYSDVEIMNIDDKSHVYSYINTPILDFKRIEFRLYDKEQKRYIGLPIIINDFSVD